MYKSWLNNDNGAVKRMNKECKPSGVVESIAEEAR